MCFFPPSLESHWTESKRCYNNSSYRHLVRRIFKQKLACGKEKYQNIECLIWIAEMLGIIQWLVICCCKHENLFDGYRMSCLEKVWLLILTQFKKMKNNCSFHLFVLLYRTIKNSFCRHTYVSIADVRDCEYYSFCSTGVNGNKTQHWIYIEFQQWLQLNIICV